MEFKPGDEVVIVRYGPDTNHEKPIGQSGVVTNLTHTYIHVKVNEKIGYVCAPNLN